MTDRLVICLPFHDEFFVSAPDDLKEILNTTHLLDTELTVAGRNVIRSTPDEVKVEELFNPNERIPPRTSGMAIKVFHLPVKFSLYRDQS